MTRGAGDGRLRHARGRRAGDGRLRHARGRRAGDGRLNHVSGVPARDDAAYGTPAAVLASPAACRIRSAPRSAIMIVGALVFPRVI